MAERINENQAKVDQLTRDWNKKWKETQKIMEVCKLQHGYALDCQLFHQCVILSECSEGILLAHICFCMHYFVTGVGKYFYGGLKLSVYFILTVAKVERIS